ncbi:MAG: hypothetical protein JWN56_2552 [Sphingobacteriales bacterium]|nr:hypothetical protein [Sphingobacteriales bacterium]
MECFFDFYVSNNRLNLTQEYFSGKVNLSLKPRRPLRYLAVRLNQVR